MNLRCHDFHLVGYDVAKFGSELVLHLVYGLSPGAEESHIRFTEIELYHFVHVGGAIIFDIEEVPLSQILDEFWERIAFWATQYGGVPHWDRDDRASYEQKLEADGLRAWEISSSIGFSGFVLAKAIEDVTDQFTPTA